MEIIGLRQATGLRKNICSHLGFGSVGGVGGPGIRSPAHARGLIARHTVDTASIPSLERRFCGNREWGLRPDTQTAYPVDVLACYRWRVNMVSKVGGGVCRRRFHSRLPMRWCASHGIDASPAESG